MKIFIFALIICAELSSNTIEIRNHEPRVHPMISGVAAMFATAASVFHKEWVRDILPLMIEKLPEKFFRIVGAGQSGEVKRLPSTLPSPTVSDSESESDLPDTQNPQEVISFEDGSIYHGETRNGRPWGRGGITCGDGSCFEGEWFDGLKHGEGVHFFEEGRLLSSQKEVWSDGNLETVTDRELREGVIEIPAGLYLGPVNEANQPHTYDSAPGTEGTIEYVDGRMYQGQLDRGQPSGDGTMRYPNGDTYKGSFYFGERHGEGILFLADGTAIEGEWLNNRINNIGNEHTIGYLDGWTYEGPLDDTGRPHGFGVLSHAGGQRYRGSFLHGQRHGTGTWRQVDGTLVSGNWQNNILNNPYDPGPGAELRFTDGTRYVGSVNDRFDPHGLGMIRLPNGAQILSHWREGEQLAGFGEGPFGGSVYRGQYFAENPHGEGLITNPHNGQTVHGTLENGDLVEELLFEQRQSPQATPSPDTSVVWSDGMWWDDNSSRSNSPGSSEW